MKKIWFALVSITIAFSTIAEQFSERAQYVTLDKPASSELQIVEFFSFYCPHCYEFEQIFHVSENVKKVLSADTKIVRYHVDFLGPLGKPLTQAWAVAMGLGMEDKVSSLMFKAVQKTQTLKTSDDIRSVFVKAGVSAADYDAALNSFLVKSLVLQQEKAVEDLKLRSVPAVFVNGKYMVKNDGLDTNSIDAYAKQFADVIKFLSQQK